MCVNRKGKYILYGTGIDLENFLFQNQELIPNISFCIGNVWGGATQLHNIQVWSPEAININDYVPTHFIIVTCDKYSLYEEIKVNLLGNGMKEWDDFIWSQCFGKKIAVINANCYKDAVSAYLQRSAAFCNEYMIYPLPPIQRNEKKEIDVSLLKHTDLFIHQDIRAENQYGYKLSDEYISQFLPEGVKNICIPNLVDMGQWMYPNLRPQNVWRVDKYATVMGGDDVLDKAVIQYNSFNEIKKFWLDFHYESEQLDEMFTTCMNKIKAREENWDIKVYDFIKENYRKIPCFTDSRHISFYLLRVIGRQVADLLGLSDIEDEKFTFSQGYCPPLLNCVSKYYNLEFQVPRQKRGDYLGKKVMDEVDDYIRAYCYGFYGMIL